MTLPSLKTAEPEDLMPGEAIDLFAAPTLTAISLWQPHASLMFADLQGVRVKPDETRGWPFPERLRGRDVVVHAAKHPIRRDDYDDRDAIAELCAKLFGSDWRKSLPFGEYLGLVRFDQALPMRLHGPLHELDELCGHWAPHRWAWRTTNPRPFAQPVPGKGQQGFWRVSTADLAPALVPTLGERKAVDGG